MVSVLVAVVAIAIAYYFLIYNKPSNKLKRYLESNSYTCNKKVCTKEENNNRYKINYETGDFALSDNNYVVSLNKQHIILELKKENYSCSFEKEGYQRNELVDDKFDYNYTCSLYINDVNRIIEEYRKIIVNSGLNVNEFEK